jgi:hypothetical protein
MFTINCTHKVNHRDFLYERRLSGEKELKDEGLVCFAREKVADTGSETIRIMRHHDRLNELYFNDGARMSRAL